MTPLTKQLEEAREKLEFARNHYELASISILEDKITILEQAIAEIKKIQSQQTKPLEFVETDRGCKPISLTGITRCNSSKDKTADISNLLQKQRQEILDKIRLEFHTFREEFIESELDIEDFDIGNLLYNIEQQLAVKE